MADVDPQGFPSRESDHKHELRDVNLRGVLTAGGCLVAIAVALHLALWGFLTLLDSRPKKADVSLSPLARLPREAPPPRLQAYPPLDLKDFRAREDAKLNGYQWTDRAAGHVQIPVERAKERFLKEAAGQDRSDIRKPDAAPAIPAPAGGRGNE